MKPKGLVIATVLLAALAGLIWWSNKTHSGTPADNSIKLLTAPAEDIEALRIKRISGEDIQLRRETGGEWTMVQPKQLSADQDVVAAMITTVATLTADHLIEEKPADLKTFGLQIPVLEVTVTRKGGKSQELLIGDETPSHSNAYAKLANDPKVYTVAAAVRGHLDKGVEDIRDKRLLQFDPEKLTRVELQAKGPAVEVGKSGEGQWQIIRPRPLRADNAEVNSFVEKVREAKLDPLGLPEDAAKSFASATRVALVSLTDAGGTHTLEIRKDKENNYFAKSSSAGTFKTYPETGDALAKGLDDFRDKKLFDFGFSDPTKLEIKNVTYVKSGDKWMEGQKALDGASVQSLIDKLRDLSASSFAESGGGEPAFQATVTSDGGKRVERVSITKQGTKYFAKREGEPSNYVLDATAVEDLQKAAADVKPATPEPAKK
jgi:hypothetical protein